MKIVRVMDAKALQMGVKSATDFGRSTGAQRHRDGGPSSSSFLSMERGNSSEFRVLIPDCVSAVRQVLVVS